MLVSFHNDEVQNETKRERHEPCIYVKIVQKTGVGRLTAWSHGRVQKTWNDGGNGNSQHDDSAPIDAVGVYVSSFDVEKPREIEFLFAQDPVIANKYSGDCSH